MLKHPEESLSIELDGMNVNRNMLNVFTKSFRLIFCAFIDTFGCLSGLVAGT